ncbi:MAG: hypothetical protein J5742_03680 [Alphaproteobacteria bacterium]|nr:hypothetical protein [Alphaproteobacteria bacterium]
MPSVKVPEVDILTADHDRHNLAYIDKVAASGRINDEAATYLRRLYADGMSCYREVFHILGKCFGAPKTAVTEYDSETDLPVNKPIKIIDINPLSSYLVNHRLDADPMRNQFFTSGAAHKIDLSVSSIVTVIVGSQKNVERALDKVTGKYYRFFTEDVILAVTRAMSDIYDEKYIEKIIKKIQTRFSEKYVTDAAEEVISVLGPSDDKLVVKIVRELDKVKKPHLYLNDVWRVKCLFDLIPQARTFIERLRDIMPERIISVRDKFYDIGNPRNYRDSKIIVNIGTPDSVIPMEIICQVRTFFEFERKTHDYYAMLRERPDAKNLKIEQDAAELMENGIIQYNMVICRCLDDLFDRMGWNILYSRGGDVSLFEGFPRECKLYYPQPMLEKIFTKLDAAVKNEIFHITHSSSKLDMTQEIAIFRFMARFILCAAMPRARAGKNIPGDRLSVRLFNFIMNEVYRYYNTSK